VIRFGLPEFGKPVALTERWPVAYLGLREALALPAPMLMISMIGFGSLCRETGFSLDKAVVTTAAIWGLPGQITLVELLAAGSPAFAILFAVAMTSARFLPMVATMMPFLREGVGRRFWLFPLAHFVTANSWVFVIRRSPDLQPTLRLAYFLGFVAACMIMGLSGTVLGYWLVSVVSVTLVHGLLFLNPIYFMLLFVDVRGLGLALAVLLGALGGPLIGYLSAEWGVVIVGLLSGTLAFFIGQLAKRRGHG
jgi:predicted branched-subunit amino acid permease